MPDFDIEPYFEEAQAFIHDGIKINEGVLVVCTAGISRSAAIVISYLIRHQGMTYDEAYQKTKVARVYIKPNPGFVRILNQYAVKVRCELCKLEKRTQWLEQYTQKNLIGEVKFQALICEQCDQPMVVYFKDHQQKLSNEDILLAFSICEQIGNDFYGLDNWYIDGNQRTIPDHFHWHVRPISQSPLQSLSKKDVSIQTFSTDNIPLESLKSESLRLLAKHASIDEKYHITEKTIQIVEGVGSKNHQEGYQIESKLRLKYQDLLVVRQIIKQRGKMVAWIQYRLLKKQQSFNDILSKL